MDVWWLLLIAALLACASLAAYLAARMRVATAEGVALRQRVDSLREDAQQQREARAAAEAAASRIGGLEAERGALQREVVTLSSRIAGLEAQLDDQQRAHAQTVAALTAIRGEIEKDLKNIAGDSLRANQDSFLKLANEVLDKHKEGAAADLEARRGQIDALVAPIRDTLRLYQDKLAEMETTRAQAYGAISTELRTVVEAQNAVRTETSKLVNALRAAPKTRGRWGEHTLRNVLELAGLSAYCDFAVEQSYTREGTVSRPDVVIRLPGKRNIVVDAKASMAAYLDAVEAVEDQERERHLTLHAAQLRTQVKLLAGKAYWDGLAETPDFVVMFVPGENFYAAAAERDPGLFEYAVAQRVLIATPASLIAVAKSVAYGWRQEKVADNAKRVHELGRDLYRRLATMGDHIAGLGRHLTGTVKKYNDFVGSLEASVLPQARRFNELEVEGTASDITALPAVESEPRLPRSDRDIPVLSPRGSTPEAA